MANLDRLANEIEQAAHALPFKTMLKGSSATLEIMQVFGKLGQHHGYEVCCSNYAERNHPNWLYDMTWCVMKDGMLSQIPMVLESELNIGPRQKDAVDPDFQKLVQSRADIRVWISVSPNNPSLHIENCKHQIRTFAGSVKGDRYVFAVYDWTAEKPMIQRFEM